MLRRLHRLALRAFGRLPRRARRRIVRVVAPTFTVGAMCFVERDDGAILLVRHSYRRRWGTPGGLLNRGERPEDAVRREVREEVGLDVELAGAPAVVVDTAARRVDIVFRGRVAAGFEADSVVPSSTEIVACGWFTPGELPDLQHETGEALAAAGVHRSRLPGPDAISRRGRPRAAFPEGRGA